MENPLNQQAALDRKLAQKSLYYLCKEILGYKDMVPSIHGDFCTFLTDTPSRFKQATLPRAHFKTWVATVGLAIWLTLPDEEGEYKDIFPWKGSNARLLIASNVIDNAAKMVFKIKQEWMNNDRLQAAFPELIPDFNKTRWSDHVAQVERSINATEGTYTAVGVGGSVISQHFDMILEDDLIYARKDDFTGQELMPSQEDIDNAIGWHKLSFSLLANPGTGCIHNIGTRWAPRDLIYYIRNFEDQYACFEIRAEDDKGEPVWPERYPRAVLDQIRAAQGNRMYETQYLNMPRATEDIVFKKEYVNIHTTFGDYPTGIIWRTVVDLAGWGDSKGTARNVVLTAGMDDKHHIWVARLDAGRYNPTEVMHLYKEHSRQFDSKIWTEEVQYQRALSHFSREEMERTGEWFSQERLPYDGRANAKDLRIRSIEPLVTNGGLHILASMKPLLEELEFYPYSKTKDILDCLGYMYKISKPVIPARCQSTLNPFSMEAIEKELKRGGGITGLPFDLQLANVKGIYGRN